MMGGARAAPLLLLFLWGCAGGRVYEHGINHGYLCAVRVVRTRGYVLREQEFKEDSGTLVAAISTPDPRKTIVKRGIFTRAGEFVWNAWEHMKFDRDRGGGARVRTEQRIIVKFRASGGGLFGWLDWHSKDRVTLSVKADVTDYGQGDWVIHREGRPREYRDGLYRDLGGCLEGERVTAPSETPAPAGPGTSPAPAAPPTAVSGGTTGGGPAEKPKETGPASGPVARPPAAPVAAVPPPETSAIPASPEEAADVLRLGRETYEAGKYREATGYLERVIKAEPENAEALGYLGACYYQEGKVGDAIKVYERYLALVPGDFRTREFVEEMKKGK